MTRNQLRAVALAHEIKHGTIDPSTLQEYDWHLLLLAAGLNKISAPPRLIVRKVLDSADRHIEYFAESRQPRH